MTEAACGTRLHGNRARIGHGLQRGAEYDPAELEPDVGVNVGRCRSDRRTASTFVPGESRRRGSTGAHAPVSGCATSAAALASVLEGTRFELERAVDEADPLVQIASDRVIAAMQQGKNRIVLAAPRPDDTRAREEA
ncbi:MAG: hypothetical protein ACOC0E_11140 [Spirochaetota bacterium]